MAHKAVEEKALIASKLTLEDKENWDEEPALPPEETPPWVRPILLSQEDEWKLMVDQDPCSGSVTGNSGHGMMAMTEAKPIDSNEGLTGAMGGINKHVPTGIDENLSAGYLSDVEWKEEHPLFKINDENVTIPKMPAAASTPVQASTENEKLSTLKSPMGKKPCFWESTMAHLLNAAPPLHLEPDYSNAELVGYTQPSLTNFIP